jgi:predicted PurR-regulated permease PerM
VARTRTSTTTKRHKVPGWPIAATLAVLFLFLYYVREVLLPFVVAGALGFILSPLVDRAHRHLRRLPRWVAALLIYALVLACLGAICYGLGPVIAADFSDLAAHIPDILHRFVEEVGSNGQVAVLGQNFAADAIVQALLDKMRSFSLSGPGLFVASRGVAAIFGIFLTLVLLAYFLVSGARLRGGLLWLVPPEYRGEIRRLATKIAPVLARYFTGLVLIVCYTSLSAWVAFAWVFKVPYAPLLALAIGLLELVPVVGPLTSIALVGMAALQQGSVLMAVSLGAFAVALRLSIDQLVGPLVLGRAAHLHPVVIIFALLSGAVFLGVLGLVLAVPVAASIKIVLLHYYEEEIVP